MFFPISIDRLFATTFSLSVSSVSYLNGVPLSHFFTDTFYIHLRMSSTAADANPAQNFVNNTLVSSNDEQIRGSGETIGDVEQDEGITNEDHYEEDEEIYEEPHLDDDDDEVLTQNPVTNEANPVPDTTTNAVC